MAPRRAQAGKAKVEVRIAALYHEGRSYPKGSVLEVTAEDARTLMASGEVGKPGGLAAERKAAEDEEASRPRCSRCRRILRAGMGDPCQGCRRALSEPLADPYDPEFSAEAWLLGALRG
jgi:hypothetical protein